MQFSYKFIIIKNGVLNQIIYIYAIKESFKDKFLRILLILMKLILINSVIMIVSIFLGFERSFLNLGLSNRIVKGMLLQKKIKLLAMESLESQLKDLKLLPYFLRIKQQQRNYYQLYQLTLTITISILMFLILIEKPFHQLHLIKWS